MVSKTHNIDCFEFGRTRTFSQMSDAHQQRVAGTQFFSKHMQKSAALQENFKKQNWLQLVQNSHFCVEVIKKQLKKHGTVKSCCQKECVEACHTADSKVSGD